MHTLITRDQSIGNQILKGFFAILPSRIAADFDSLASSKKLLREEEKSFRSRRWSDPGEVVESLHRRLLLGSESSRNSSLPGDLLLFSATLAAHEIACLSCSVSTGSGVLRDLAGMIESAEDGKEEKIRLSETLFEQIHDSVFVEVLERYAMKKYAVIFESNRPLYEIRSEVGRRLIMGGVMNEKECDEVVQKFRTLYGPEFAEEFLRRLRKHNLLPVQRKKRSSIG